LTRRGRYAVEWAEIAVQDLLEIIGYLATRNPGAAASLLDSMEQKAASLVKNPGRGRVVPELLRLQLREYRELIVGAYRFVCRVEASRVFILAVLDSRRDLQDLLLDRLIG
jgi:plasmid stabilization system protein ParE